MRRAALAVTVFVALAVGALMAATDPVPLEAARVHRIARQMNEAAAIAVPHGYLMDEALRAQNRALLSRVEHGDVLDADASALYRGVIQAVLLANQAFLARFDRELTVLADHAMHRPNNARGHGIAGRHDHHDLSARLNFAALLAELAALDEAAGWPGAPRRILAAARAWKDLADIVGHLGVSAHSVSVPYEPPPAPWPDQDLGGRFEAMLMAYKQAQAEPVNSPAYWQSMDSALDACAAMILAVQVRIVSRTRSWERRLSGHFLSPQTLATPVELDRPLRPRPAG
ncbi:MAG: hypothetical protein WAT70_13835 [Rhizobiaceae bacterium]